MAKYFLRLGEREIEAELEETPAGLRINLEGNWHEVALQRLGDSPRYVLVAEGRLLEVLVEEGAQGFNVQIGGRGYEIETGRTRPGRRRDEGDQFVDGKWLLRAPLTGVVTEVRVAAGDRVEQGGVLLVIEAMKMLNELRCRVPGGVVTAVLAAAKDRVEIGAPLVEVSAAPGTDLPP